MKISGKAPKKITKDVKSFLNRAYLTGNPIFLKYTSSNSTYLLKQCFDNCLVETRDNGGEIIFGWLIWEIKLKNFIEAELHAVVKRNGKYYDVTPRQDNEYKVLFIPDNRYLASLTNGIWNSWSNIKSLSGEIENTYKIQGVSKLDMISSMVEK